MGRLVGENHAKLDFQHGIQSFGGCFAFQQQLQMFCFNATGYIGSVFQVCELRFGGNINASA